MATIQRFTATLSGDSGGAPREVTIEPIEGGTFRVTIDGRARMVDACRVEDRTWSLGTPGGGAVRLVDVDGAGPDYAIGIAGQVLALRIEEGRPAAGAEAGAGRARSGLVRSPMPGKVVKVLVREGDEVKAGQGVIVVEAMKMENELKAPRDGKVEKVSVVEGATVEANAALLTIG